VKVTADGVPVDELISVVKNSVKRGGVSRTSDSTDLRVGSVQLILEVVATRSAGGSLRFRVPFIGMDLGFGVKVTKQDTHTIDVTLVPPGQPADGSREIRGGDVEDVLVEAIAAIRETMASAALGDDPWLLSEGSVNISFAVTETGSISLGADGELGRELTHTLHLGLVPFPG
jgi:hypothetical protein